jgi:type IV pilus assembly protein PilY1
MLSATLVANAAINIAQVPLFVNQAVAPLALLVMGRDHKLYYEAYNDASDLNRDGSIDTGYEPGIDYYGYFDSYKCYSYVSGVFTPAATTATKKCSGAGEWSGDFLNYVTMTRIDTLRKVFYGGRRSTDGTSQTILERTHIPQDAHSWGKEYQSIARDGYDIREYTPLSLPGAGRYHILANTTLLAGTAPLLRVLENTGFRVWEWVSIERPVAGDKCLNGGSGPSCTSAGGNYNSTPANHVEYEWLVSQFANADHLYGSGVPINGQINGSGNPYGGNDYYLTIFKGQLNVAAPGTYEFAVDGDDAVEVIIDDTVVASFYGAHAECNCTTHKDSIDLASGSHEIEFRHQEKDGGDNYFLHWNGPDSGNNWQLVPALSFSGLTQSTYDVVIPASARTDYTVRVEVCKAGLLESNCQSYPSGAVKPTGLLHEFGEDDTMMFGLLTGTYAKNLDGGVLRKNIESFSNEVDPSTGQFDSSVDGIVHTIDALKTVDFGGSYEYGCGWITTRAVNSGECTMWGNPVGEMMYEGLRYFAGKTSATADFAIPTTGNFDKDLGLPLPAWSDPYDATTGYPSCAKPFQLVISDINPSYDTDKLPGSYFGSGFAGDITGLNVQTEATTISSTEIGGTVLSYIGQSGSNYDGAPTAKNVSGLGNIRGLSPEEPTKRGGYYSASVAYYGLRNDINAAPGDQNMQTFAVALASPLPRIEIPVSGQTVTLVPFAKSVGGSSISSAEGDFQPTNTIVDFYVESLTPTSGTFRINYEDVEQGADHDMDAIVVYTYTVNPDQTITVNLDSTYAAGGIIQHMGYVISGTTADGVYLDVRDVDTAAASDPDYFLDTPNTAGTALPLTKTRTFTPGSGTAASLLRDPLWYAAKWGGFIDSDADDIPQGTEWDGDGDGTPDTYFQVTNALGLQSQLRSAFTEIVARTGSASAVATNSTRLDTDTLIYQARFNSGDWHGELLAYRINPDGTVGSVLWDAADQIPAAASRNIYTIDPTVSAGARGREFLWGSTYLTTAQMDALNTDSAGTNDGLGQQRLAYLRGDSSQEQQNGGSLGFRDRVKVLGDVVNSDPWYVGTENFGYDRLPGSEGSDYESFRSTSSYNSRRKMLYVGANDGMMHAIDAEYGTEIFTYVPNAVFPELSALTSSNYGHQYYVDGPLRSGDAYIDPTGSGTDAWRTVLLGSTGGGGRAIYALDVTDPDDFTTSAAAQRVLWEFSNSNDAELGYTVGQPAVVRMANGKWAAMFGNGYNSASGKAQLFIVDVEDGSLIARLDTQTGSAAAPNGLTTPTPIDVDGDRIVDFVYAGDLFGNMWKFDVRSNSPLVWGVVFSNLGVPVPLFTACDATPCTGSNFQPVTAKAQVGLHPDGGLMVYFGTGSYFQDGDDIVGATPQVHSFYGIRDVGLPVLGSRLLLTEQEILAEIAAGAELATDGAENPSDEYDVRVTSDNAVDYSGGELGWYIDLVSPVNGEEGERVVAAPLLRGGRIIFTTVIPDPDPCAYGGDSWLMEMEAVSGSRLTESPFDLDGDGEFTDADYVIVYIAGVEVRAPVSGQRSNIGIIKTPGIISAGTKEFKYTSGSSGLLGKTTESSSTFTGRQSWRQVR